MDEVEKYEHQKRLYDIENNKNTQTKNKTKKEQESKL